MAAAPDLYSLKDPLILLATAGVIVPLMQRLRISPVLGFLVAGALLGPNGFGALLYDVPALYWLTVSEKGHLAWIGDFGVVFLLFVIGLELSLERVLTMRRLVFGLGTAQVLVSAIVIAGIAAFFGNSLAASIIIGACLALSSTAIVIELLSERQRMTSATGRVSFAMLLFQDLAVVPLLFLVSVLGGGTDGSVLSGLITAVAQALATVIAIVLVGRRLLRPFFRMVASSGSSELFMAATLFVVIGTGALASAAGLSMALGAFIAGLLLAETEYRRAIEALIDPFKGLLLGVFFFVVGMGVDIRAIGDAPLLVLGSAVGLVVIKASIIIVVARGFRVSWPTAIESGFLLGPGGEFAFVVLGLAIQTRILPEPTGAFMLLVTTLSMAGLPLAAWIGARLAKRVHKAVPLPESARIAPPGDGVRRAIVVGHGRVGDIVCDMLTRHRVPYLAVDGDPAAVASWRRRGRPVYYGDASNPMFLDACGLAEARAVIITIHAQASIDRIVKLVREKRPDIVVVSRARDALHARHLYEMGVSDAVPETIEASLQLSEAALVGLGLATGPVIASIHEKRDEVRHDLQVAVEAAGRTTTGLHAVKPKKKAEPPADSG